MGRGEKRGEKERWKGRVRNRESATRGKSDVGTGKGKEKESIEEEEGWEKKEQGRG